jgi:hypothetical protein
MTDDLIGGWYEAIQALRRLVGRHRPARPDTAA